VGFIKKLLKGEPDREKAEKLVAKGVERARQGDLEGALKLYRDAQRADPAEPLARVNEALALLDRFNRDKDGLDDDDRRARLGEIRASLEDAVDYAPEDLGALRALLHVRRRLGDFSAAARTARRLLDAAPDDFPYKREVEKDLREIAPRAARQEATDNASRLALDEDASEEQQTEALEALTPFLEGDDVERDARWAAGVLARRLEKDEDAADHFRAILDDAPGDLGAHRELADLYARNGNAKRALKHSLEAYRADPMDPGLVCNVGVCHLELGDLDQAEEYLEIARGLDPGGAIVQRAWSALQARRGGE
jgi:Flp pilus assembly protein TadD